jgi:hypothetical protein
MFFELLSVSPGHLSISAPNPYVPAANRQAPFFPAQVAGSASQNAWRESKVAAPNPYIPAVDRYVRRPRLLRFRLRSKRLHAARKKDCPVDRMKILCVDTDTGTAPINLNHAGISPVFTFIRAKSVFLPSF